MFVGQGRSVSFSVAKVIMKIDVSWHLHFQLNTEKKSIENENVYCIIYVCCVWLSSHI